MKVSTSYLNKQNKKISEQVHDMIYHQIWTGISVGVSDIEEREREAEHLLKEIVTENFPNLLETNMDNQVHTDESSNKC